MIHRTFVTVLCACLPAVAHAQGGGFQAGDLYLYSPAIQGISTFDGAIVRIDLAANTSAIFVDTFLTFGAQNPIAFDPYRQRLVFCASVGSAANPFRLWAADAAGNLTDMGFSGMTLSSFAPTGDGRIYLRTHLSPTPLAFVDAVGAMNTLMDASGTAPFKIDGNGGFDARGMIYDSGTNSLFVASGSGSPCPGGILGRVSVHKLPLSTDGTRVVGPVTCTQFEVSASGETPVGWSRLPSGEMLLVVDTNANALEPRMLAVDPVTLAINVFASNNHLFSAATNAGTWSSSLSKAVILETGSDKFIAFAAGESGAGTGILPVGVNVSSAGSSGEIATLIEIPPSSCAGAWHTYGAGKKGAGDFVPRIYGVGCPDIGGSFGLTIDRTVGAAPGVLFVGLSESNVPFLGATLLTFPILLQLNLVMPGPAGSPGAGSLTIPAALDPNPALAGISIHMQGLFADAAATQGVSFTQGLRMTIGS